MKPLVVVTSLVLLSCVAVSWIFWAELDDYLSSPLDPKGEDRVVNIPAASTPESLSALLAEEALIDRPEWFSAYAGKLRARRPIVAGEYRLSPSMSPVQQLDRLQSGEIVLHTVVLDPGLGAREIVSRLVAEGLGDEASLMALVGDPSFARELGLPSKTLDGFLFPDVYQLPRGLAPRRLLAHLVERFRRLATGEVGTKARARGLDDGSWVRLASLIETSGLPKPEWPVYSAMLQERLRLGLPLDHDANRAWARNARALARKWDTASRPGLPPWPFGNPGSEALSATAHPASLKVLFMVQNGDGTFAYCPDPECYRLALPPSPTR